MQNEKKNQHFVPRSFLKNFALDLENTLIWGYDKKYGKCTGKRFINKICSFDFYYEQIKPDGSKTQTLEDGFQNIENAATNIIRNLSISQIFSSSDKGCLAWYLGLLITRGPSFRDGIHEFLRHKIDILRQKEYESGRLPEPPPEVKEMIVNKDINSVIKTEIFPHASLQYMFNAISQIGPSLCDKKWDFYFIKNDEYFITSDTPVMFEDFNKQNWYIGPEHSESVVFCPITKNMLLIVRPFLIGDHKSIEFMPVKDGMVDAFNKMMCFNAERFVYASEKSDILVEYIKETKDYCKKFRAHRFDDTIIPHWDTNINL